MMDTFPTHYGEKILSIELSDLPAVEVIGITNDLVLQTSDYAAS